MIFPGTLQERYLLHPGSKSISSYLSITDIEVRVGQRDKTLQSWRRRTLTILPERGRPALIPKRSLPAT